MQRLLRLTCSPLQHFVHVFAAFRVTNGFRERFYHAREGPRGARSATQDVTRLEDAALAYYIQRAYKVSFEEVLRHVEATLI